MLKKCGSLCNVLQSGVAQASGNIQSNCRLGMQTSRFDEPDWQNRHNKYWSKASTMTHRRFAVIFSILIF